MSEEQVATVDESGAVVGSAPRSVMRRDNLAHVVVAVLLRDPAGRVYVHRRPLRNDHGTVVIRAGPRLIDLGRAPLATVP